jgi:hypothetical protein
VLYHQMLIYFYYLLDHLKYLKYKKKFEIFQIKIYQKIRGFAKLVFFKSSILANLFISMIKYKIESFTLVFLKVS